MQKKLVAAIYQKVRHIYEDETSGKFLCLPNATTVLSPEDIKCLGSLDTGDTVEEFERNSNSIFDFSRRMNSPIHGITTAVEEGEMLWEIYDQILKNAILAKGHVDDSMKKDYDRALGILYQDGVLRNPSEKYDAYRTYRDQYFKIVEECNCLQSSLSSSSGEETNSLQKELESAKSQLTDIQRDWSLLGYKDEVEEALTIFENSLVDNPYSFWQELKKNFNPDLELQARADRGYYATTFIFPTSFVDEKWDSIRISGEELEKLYANAPDEVQNLCDNGENLTRIKEIRLEYRSVRVERPWFNPSIFKSRLWRLPAELNHKISYGTKELVGRFPAYVSALLLLRNIQITYTSSGASGASGSSLSIPDRSSISVLAYICKRIPESPNPDEKADWGDAVKSQKTATLQIQQKTGGRILAHLDAEEVGSGTFKVGESIKFKATPNSRYILTQWIVNGRFIENKDYTFECSIPEEGLTIAPCWELGETLDPGHFKVEKDTLVSIDNGPAILDMNRYRDLYRIKVIAENAFRDYPNLCSVTIGNFVEVIGGNAFSDCRKLERISIPATTRYIHNDAFARDNFQSEPIIQVDPANETYMTLDGILVEKRMTRTVKTLTCRCGAKYYFTENAPSVCPACGCALDAFPVQSDIVRMPDVKIPFRVTQQEAEELVHAFYAKKGFAAKEFKQLIAESSLELRPVYAPYWEWNVQANGSFSVKVYKQQAQSGGDTNAERECEIHEENVSIPEIRLSVPASRVVKDVVFSSNNTYTEQFCFGGEPGGTAFELPSKGMKESQKEEREQVLKKLRDLAKKPYDNTLLKSCEDGIVDYVSETSQLLINPIWIGSFNYKEKPYSFYVDGNTGKVTAKNRFPKNWGKIGILVGSILAAIALIVLLIVLLKPKPSIQANKDTEVPTVTNTTTTRPASSNRKPSARTTLLAKNESYFCDGVYDSSAQIKETLGNKLNRNDFTISFDFNSATDGSESARINNILTLDSFYRSLGLAMKNKTIHVTVNNQRQDIDTGIPIKPGEWQHVDLSFTNGQITINGKEYQVGTLNGPGDNVLSTNNYSNGQAFKGNIRNLVVSTKVNE